MQQAFEIPGFEQRVRDRAYAIWESEGRPAGRDAEHWRLSEVETLAALAPRKPAPAARKGKKAKRAH